MSKKHKVVAAAGGGTSTVTEQPEPDFPMPAELTDVEIAARAYSYWQSRGFQGGSPEDDWHKAVEELTAERQPHHER